MPRQRRGIRGDVGIAPYTPSIESPCVAFGRTEPRPYNSLPYLRRIPALSFRASVRREASALGVHTGVGIRSLFMSTAAKGRHLPLPLCGKGGKKYPAVGKKINIPRREAGVIRK